MICMDTCFQMEGLPAHHHQLCPNKALYGIVTDKQPISARIEALEARQNEIGAALGRIEREMEKLTATMEQGLMALGYNLQAIHKCVKPRRRRK